MLCFPFKDKPKNDLSSITLSTIIMIATPIISDPEIAELLILRVICFDLTKYIPHKEIAKWAIQSNKNETWNEYCLEKLNTIERIGENNIPKDKRDIRFK